MYGLVLFEGANYEVNWGRFCILNHIAEDCDHFRVPSAISTSDGEKYQVTRISSSKFMEGERAHMISFDESSEITWVPVWFIGRCISTFILPPKVKRVTGYCTASFPKIVSEKRFQQFVSTSGSRVIMNHFPLEVAYQHSRRQHFIIRETVRFVGDYAFHLNERITTVVFPPSVEYIGEFSFFECCNLRFIIFMGNSKLKTIGKNSFRSSSLKSINIPSNVEEIRDSAFSCCMCLISATFNEDSKLKIIGKNSFRSTSLESINIPSNVEEIRDYAFSCCKYLKSVRYHNTARIRTIGKGAFANCPNLSH